jgi:hypothetical protein
MELALPRLLVVSWHLRNYDAAMSLRIAYWKVDGFVARLAPPAITLLAIALILLPLRDAVACSGGEPPWEWPSKASTVSSLELPARPAGPAVYQSLDGFAVLATADDLLAVLDAQRLYVERPGDLAELVRGRLPLSADLNLVPLLDELTGELLNGDEALSRRKRTTLGKFKLSYAFAYLLSGKKAAIMDTVLDKRVPLLEVEKYSEACWRGTRLRIPSGRELLHIPSIID